MVLSAVLASAGYAAMITVTETSPSTHGIPPSTAGKIVFSVRNDATTPLTISSFTQQIPTPTDCTKFGPVTPLGMTTPAPVTILPGEQAQFEVKLTTNANNSGACTYDLHDSSTATIGSVTVTSVVGTDDTDLQPRVMTFRTKAGSSEDQRVSLFNYTGATLSASSYSLSIVGANATWFAFVDANCTLQGPQTCKPTSSISNNSSSLFNVRCMPPVNASGSAFANVLVFAGSNMPVGTNQISCFVPPAPPAIKIINPNKTITINTAVNAEGSGSAEVVSMGSGAFEQLVSASVTGGNGMIYLKCPGMTAPAASCTYMPPMPLSMAPIPLPVYCKPTSTTMLSATLQVSGSASTDTGTVNCFPSTSGPYLTAMPLSLAAPDTLVGDTSPTTMQLQLDNLGDTPVTNVVISVADPNWSAGACTSGNPCTVVKGTPQLVTFTFAPKIHGPLDAQATISSSDTVHMVGPITLHGVGIGARLEQVDPPPGDDITIGPIGRNQLVTRTITVHDDGNINLDITAALSGGMPQLTITPAAQNGVGSNSDATFTVGCQSATQGSFNGSATIAAAQAYAGSPITIPVHCEVAATTLQVTPPEIDFGEVRLGSGARMIPVDIFNPGPDDPVNPTGVSLAGSRPGLSLDNGFLGGSHPIPKDGTLMPKPTVKLDPKTETDLAGVSLSIAVDGETLMYPVKGKVVKPASYVTPTHLDLGTICVGSTTGGIETLVNSGTATLDVKAPAMNPNQQFVVQSNLPGMLPAGEHADITVKPQTTAKGTLHAVLTIEDDVPSKYDVDVDAEIIDGGTAVSPRALSFGTIHAGTKSPPLSITLENCGLEPVDIAVGKVAAHKGAASAWEVMPGTGFTRTLGSHEKQPVAVSFAPKNVGDYNAELQLAVGGEQQIVMLAGLGGGDQQNTTSFYACGGCATGSPLGLAPLVGAVGFIILRRRRGSS